VPPHADDPEVVHPGVELGERKALVAVRHGDRAEVRSGVPLEGPVYHGVVWKGYSFADDGDRLAFRLCVSGDP
jgi:hypothetical protein